MLNLKEGIKIILLLLFITGCKNTTDQGEDIKIIYYNEIKANKEYIGKIIMEHGFDSIALKENDKRNKSLYLLQSDKILTVEYLESKKDNLPRFGEIEENNDTLYFTYEFKKEGEFYLEGIVDDAVLIKNYYKDGSSRLLNNITKISEKVTVTK